MIQPPSFNKLSQTMPATRQFATLTTICMIALRFTLPENSTAQNLAPNPNFEKFVGMSNGFSESTRAFEKSVTDWKVANRTTPDYAILLARRYSPFGEAHSGPSMVGLLIENDWAECVFAKLTEPLEANTTYYLEFWIKRSKHDFMLASEGSPSLCPPAYASPNFGILLSDTVQRAYNRSFLTGTPQLRCGERFWVDKDWLKISGYFTADKPYHYAYIGQFRPEGHEGPMPETGYVLVDDVLIQKVEMNAVSVEGALKTPGAIIPLDQVCFETDKSVLEPRSFPALDNAAALLLRNEEIRIRINGHTDDKGSSSHNQNLSMERAKAVCVYLMAKGVDEKRLTWEGFGETKPKADNGSEVGRQKNRRVEFEVLGK